MISGYLAGHRKSAIAAIGLVVTLAQQIAPHWSGTAGITAAAAALTWLLVHEVPNAPSSSAPAPAPTIETLMPTARALYAELTSLEIVAAAAAAAAAPGPAAPASPSSPTSSSTPAAT